MFDVTTPPGNHVIKAVQYDAPKSLTRMTLNCGTVVWVPMLETQLYKPKAGDYYVVTRHGSAAFFEKAVWEGVMMKTSRAVTQMSIADMFGTYLINPLEVGARVYRFETFEGTTKPAILGDTAKPETMGMREENGYVDKPKNTFVTMSEVTKSAIDAMNQANEAAAQANAAYEDKLASKVGADKVRYKTETESAAASASNMNHLLSEMDAQVWATEFCKLNKASDHGTMLSWFACAIVTGFDEAHRRRDKADAERSGVGQNIIIKSLHAQNHKKQGQINELRKRCDEQANTIRGLKAVEPLRAVARDAIKTKLDTQQAKISNLEERNERQAQTILELNRVLKASSDKVREQYEAICKYQAPPVVSKGSEAAKSRAFRTIKQTARHCVGDMLIIEIVDALADAKLI